MSNCSKTEEAGIKIALDMQALKGLGMPDDLADVVALLASDVALLASDKARWISGESSPVNGGSKL